MAACLALARGQRGTAAGLTAQLARNARAIGWDLAIRAAARLADAAREPGRPPPPASYPRLLWVVYAD